MSTPIFDSTSIDWTTLNDGKSALCTIVGSAFRTAECTTAPDVGVDFYFEVYVDSVGSGNNIIGLVSADNTTAGVYVGANTTSWGYFGVNGTKIRNGSQDSYGTTWTAGDVVGVLVHSDSIYFSKNGIWQGVDDATSPVGKEPAYTGIIDKVWPAVTAYTQNTQFDGRFIASDIPDSSHVPTGVAIGLDSAAPGLQTTTQYYDFIYTVGEPTVQYYNLLWNLTEATKQYYDFLYSTDVNSYYNFYYEDASVATSIYNLYYQSAYNTVKSYNFMYGTPHNTQSVYNMLWDVSVPAQTSYDLTYDFAGSPVDSVYNFIYGISGVNLAENYYNFQYSLIATTSTRSELTIGVEVDTSVPPPATTWGSTSTTTPVPTVPQSFSQMPFTAVNVECSKSQYYISGSFTLADPDYFHLCYKHAPIRITLRGVTYNLVVTQKAKQIKRESVVYTVTCQSPAVKLDDIDIPTLQMEFDEKLASELAIEIAAMQGVDLVWNLQHKGAIVDQVVKAGTFYANDEKPLTVLRNLVNAMGGIVQSRPEGHIEVVHKYQTRVPDWATAVPSYILNDEVQFRSLSVTEVDNPGINTVTVSSESISELSYTLEEVEVSSTSKEIHSYHTPWGSTDVYLDTSGDEEVSISYLGIVEETYPTYDDDTEPELVEFQNGVATVSKPIYGIVEYTWIGTDLGGLVFSEEGQLESDISGESLLEIRYITKYMRWLANSTNLADVQYILRAIDE